MRSKLRDTARSFSKSAADMTALQKAATIGLVFLLCSGAVTAYVRSRPRAVRVTSGKTASAVSRERSLKVHVAGAVVSPGLYEVPEGSRVSEAIEKAGGPAPQALLDDVNLAARVQDGQKVLVPTRMEEGQTVTAAEAASGSHLINVNTASPAELDTLPGVGPALAARIVDHRKRNGPFSALEDLDSIEGIGPAKLEGLKDLVTF